MSETIQCTTISGLPWNCLVHILQYIPIIERMKLRRVSKSWKNHVDYCWLYVKGLCLMNHLPPFTTFNNGMLKVSTTRRDVARGLIVHSAPYLKVLSLPWGDDDCKLQLLALAAHQCRNLESLDLFLSLHTHDILLCTLLTNNPVIKSLNIHIEEERCFRFFDYINLETLEVLKLTISCGEKCAVTFPDVQAKVDLFYWKMNNAISGIERLLSESTLKKLTINYAPPETLELVGRQTGLESLIICSSTMDDAEEFLGYGVATKWCLLFELRNLRELELWGLAVNRGRFDEENPYSQPVTDRVVEELVRHCPLLETVELSHWKLLTDRSIQALSTLQRLQKLTISYFWPSQGITGEGLTNLSNVRDLCLSGCEALRDDCVIDLLRKNQVIQYLGFYRSSVTNDSINVAVEETQRRTNGIKLVINVRGTRVDPFRVENTSPFLEIIS